MVNTIKIPGGGIEEGKSEETAARREALEESGCSVALIKKIGERAFVDNNPKYGEMTHHSVCFLAKKLVTMKELVLMTGNRVTR